MRTFSKSALTTVTAAVVLAGAVLLASCAGTPSNGGSGSAKAAERLIKTSRAVPDFVKQAVKNAPEDVLVGIGMARLASTSQSRTVAVTRARADISRQLNTVVRDMVRDYQASSEVDPKSALAFQETMTVALSKSTLSGASVVDEDIDNDGAYWCVVQMNKANAEREVSQGAAAAKLAVPAAKSFDAEARMNEAFDRVAKEDLQVADR